MKDYSLNGEEKKSFITDIYRVGNTYTVVFADGRIFENIEVCDENFDKLTKIQEEQAERGIKNIDIFRKRATRSGVITALVGTAFVTAGMQIASLPTVQTQDPVLVKTSLGMITICGVIPAFTKFVSDRAKVKELEKIQYRDGHRKILEQFRDYPNSLAKLPRELRENIMSHYEDPFTITNMDSFDEDDLREIVLNIHKEKTLKFVYHK